MPLLYVLIGIGLLLFLMIRGKFNAFFALLLTALAVGMLNGLTPPEVLRSILKGIGDTMGNLVLLLVFGAMLGKIVEESGAAYSIAHRLTEAFGPTRIQYAILAAGFLVGLPLMYNASFLVLIPLIYTFSVVTKLPLLYLGIPLSATLSIAHGYLPPHPAPTAVAQLYGADVNRVLLFGLVPCLPAMLIAGIWLSRFFRHLCVEPPAALFRPRAYDPAQLPGLGISIFTTLVPVGLMLTGALAHWLPVGNSGIGGQLLAFISDPNIALFVAVLVALYTLGIRQGRPVGQWMKPLEGAVGSMAMIVLIIAAGGAFKQVLLDGGVSDYIAQQAKAIQLHPLLLGWGLAAVLRLAIGSATVATITAAGILVPTVQQGQVAPELMVLATGSGSLMFSHFNDIGFWMFKEYFNVSIRQTFQIWTVMECLVSLVGLTAAFALHLFLPSGEPPVSGRHRVYYLNSYHAGYASSDSVQAGLFQTLDTSRYQIRVGYLDAKRLTGADLQTAQVQRLLADIQQFAPDLLVASDDNAVRDIVVPYFKGGDLPVLFCGVNWSAEAYGLPSGNVAGMLEVLPLPEVLGVVRAQWPAARKLTVLSEQSFSEQKNTEILTPLFAQAGWEVRYRLVEDFDAWKAAFAAAQTQSDVLYLPTNGSIKGWDREQAARWAEQHTQIPTVTCDDFMMCYAAFGLTKVAAEQGRWVGQQAREILENGATPSAIPLARNRESRIWLHERLAEKIGFQLVQIDTFQKTFTRIPTCLPTE